MKIIEFPTFRSKLIVKIFDNYIEFYNPGKLPDSISVEDLLSNNYKSTPRNKLIADFCKSIGLIEKYGSGIRRIVEYFAEAQLPHPEFRNISDGFMVTVFAHKKENDPDVTDKVGDKVGDKITGNQIKILECIVKNPKISAQKIAEQIGISSRKTEDNIKKLKILGLLERVGNPKSGYWKVIHKGY